MSTVRERVTVALVAAEDPVAECQPLVPELGNQVVAERGVTRRERQHVEEMPRVLIHVPDRITDLAIARDGNVNRVS